MLCGCSIVNKFDKSNSYLSSKSCDKPLVLPKDIDSKAFDNHYPIPKIAGGSGPIKVSTLPPGSHIKD